MALSYYPEFCTCPTQIQLWSDSEFNYELTTTINPNIYTLTQDSFEQAESTFYERLKYYLTEYHKLDIEQLTVVKEYQKNRYPHWHCLIQSNDEIPAKMRQSILGGLNQNIGKTSFKQVANLGAFQDYLCKDLDNNFKKYNMTHYRIFTK